MRHFTHAPMRVSSLVSRMSSIHSATSCHLRRGKNHFHPLGDTIEYLFFGTGECEIGRSSIPPTAVAPILEYPPSSRFASMHRRTLVEDQTGVAKLNNTKNNPKE
jgi:hypothetical protein